MEFIGESIEKKDSSFSLLCKKQVQEILTKMVSNQEFDYKLGVKNIKIHENGAIINFILEPASAGADQYNANLPCTIFILDQDKQTVVVENDEKEKSEEYKRKMGEEIKPTRQTRILHRKIENTEYLKKYKTIVLFVGEILRELQKEKELNPRKH